MRLALVDIIRPYFFIGVELGPGVQQALTILHVDEYDAAWDDDAVVISGTARIDSDDPSSPFFSVNATGRPSTSPSSTSTSPLEWEWHDVAVKFRLTAARQPAAALQLSDITHDSSNVLEALGNDTGTASTDYPNTQFRLELMFDLVTVTIPWLIAAKLDGYQLVRDPNNQKVKVSLPRVLLILNQDSASSTDFDVKLGSFGAETLEDTDPAIAELLRMNPPYALFPGETCGFGFKKAILDLSETKTPPELLSLFGLGDDWQGIYLPELRFFASTQKSAGVSFNIGARELLIGLDPTPGIWGDFNFDIDFLGDALKAGIRLYSVGGELFEPELLSTHDDGKIKRYQVTVPSTAGPETENYLLMVDIESGAAPFTILAVSGMDHPNPLANLPATTIFDPASSPEDISVLQRMRLFSQDQRVAIRITSTRNPSQVHTIVLDVFPDYVSASSHTNSRNRIEDATLSGSTTGNTGTVRIESQTSTSAILVLDPPNGTLSVDGDSKPVTNGRATVIIEAGNSHDISVHWDAAVIPVQRHYFFFAFNSSVVTTARTTDIRELDELINQFGGLEESERIIRVDAYASRQAAPNKARNDELSQERTNFAIQKIRERAEILRVTIPAVIPDHAWGNDRYAEPAAGVDTRLINGQIPGNPDNLSASEYSANHQENYDPDIFQVAVISLLRLDSSPGDFSGTLSRVDEDSSDEVDRPQEPPTPQSQQPGFFRHVGASIRFEKDPVPVGFELRLTVDFKTAHEEGLEEFREDIDTVGPGLEDPDELENLPQGNPNPDDGVVECRFTLMYDPSTSTFHETLVAKAGEGDRDGLWSWGNIPSTDDTSSLSTDGWRDVLGLYFTLAPLLAETASDTANGGEVVPLVIGLAAPVAITALGIAHVLRFTHYGIELDVTHNDNDVKASLLFDVESAIYLNFKIGDFVIVTNRPDKPVKIRYKAIGFRLESQADAPVSFLPVFDSSRGYTFDLGDSGSLRVLPSLGDSLGDIIQVLGARIARTNPLNIEVELGLGVDLGIISVDKFGFRLPVDPLGTPSITAIGVGVEIPGVLTGKGYFKINDSGFVGQLDISLETVKLRIAGGVAVQSVSEGSRSATSTIVTLAVEIPGGIPLGGTGMAVFGILGLFVMHQKRNESTTARNPALEWLTSVSGDPTDLRGWGPLIDKWAFGVGLVAGTIEGGTVLNLKGMLVLELPGPRVLLFVKANILTAKPETKGTGTGTLLAVVDISPQRVLIGIKFSYEITKEVLELNIPVEAGFFYDPPEHFYVDVGSIAQPITAKILNIIEATAYFMVHGDGIPDFPLGALGGFSVATGFRASLTWGNTDIGLYLRIAAGFDIGIGFKPLFFAGRVYIEGELRLFIVSIEANAALIFRTDGTDTIISGEICGRVDFFFFSVKGCVDFTIGDDPSFPEPPDPIRDLMLQSRSPALIEGTGVDRGIDNILCRGTEDGSVPLVETREGDETVIREVFVPIDTIPLIQFEVAPEVAPDATIDGQLNAGLPAGFPGGWQKRGQNYLRYRIELIELKLVAIGGDPVPAGTSPVTEGPRPYTWRHPDQQTGSDGFPVELALLDWKPSNVDRALVQSEALDSLIDGRWENVCRPVAEAAQVLWTFRYEPLGASLTGWLIDGMAWPDAPDTVRSRPVDTNVRVKEIWRTDTFLDGMLPAKEAHVVGQQAVCPKPPRRPFRPDVEIIDRAIFSRRTTPVITSLRGNLPVSRVNLPGMLTSARLLASSRKCISKVLCAPYEIPAASIGIQNDPLRKALLNLDDQRADTLRDVVRIQGGPFRELKVLIFARSKMVIEGLVQLLAFAPGRVEIGIAPDFKRISNDLDLPDKWTDMSGPWWDDVKLARSYFPHLERAGGWDEFLITIKTEKPVLTLDIGVTPLAGSIANFGMQPPPFFVAVIEGLSEYEVLRETDETEENEEDTNGLNEALDNQERAMLLPDAEYEVVVHYSGEVGSKPEDPQDDDDPNEIISRRSVSIRPVSRTFFTDREPPRSLDPWLLVQYPPPGELYHFYKETVVVVFATDNVLELFEVYDRRLRAVARAASFRGSEETPDAPFTHLLLAPVFEKLEGAILSPWESSIRHRLADRACLNLETAGNRHGRVNLPFAMDPLTDYIMEVEMLDPSDRVVKPSNLEKEVGERPLFRMNFSTSRYPTREACAEAVRIARVSGKVISNFTPLASLSGMVSDEALDVATMAAEIPLNERPESPTITVLWSTDSTPQPLAIVIETPEPLWRMRDEPEPEYDDTGEYILRWRLNKRQWLEVDELVRSDPGILVHDGGDFLRRTTALKQHSNRTIAEFRNDFIGPRKAPSAPIPLLPLALVDKFVRDESGTRTLAILKPGARGNTLTLGLSRVLHPLLDIDTSDTPVVLCEVDVSFAPWEELS